MACFGVEQPRQNIRQFVFIWVDKIKRVEASRVLPVQSTLPVFLHFELMAHFREKFFHLELPGSRIPAGERDPRGDASKKALHFETVQSLARRSNRCGGA